MCHVLCRFIHMVLITPVPGAGESISPVLSKCIHACLRFMQTDTHTRLRTWKHTHKGMRVKSCKKMRCDAAPGGAASENSFSPSAVPSLTSSSLCLFVYSLSLPLSPPSFLLCPFAHGQRKALTPWLLPGLRCQVFFIFLRKN